MFAIRNSTIAKMDFHSEVSDAFFVETEKIIEQVTFTKKMADNEFEKTRLLLDKEPLLLNLNFIIEG